MEVGVAAGVGVVFAKGVFVAPFFVFFAGEVGPFGVFGVVGDGPAFDSAVGEGVFIFFF